jgi:putative ABC transport system permease protein
VGEWDTQSFIDVILAENPDIISATAAHSPPYKITRGFSGFSWEGSAPEIQDMEFLTAYSDYHYLDVWGIELVEGDFLSRHRNNMKSNELTREFGYFETVINQTFQKLMGVDNPIGMLINFKGTPRKIIGVVKDFNFKPLTQPIQPLMMVYEPMAMFIMYVKTNGRDNQRTMQWVIDKYNEMRPGPTPLTSWKSAEDEYRSLHQSELRTRTIMAILSAIALFLSLLGVVSMVSFMLEKRTKDIAIRKINGATEWNIITLFGREILTSCIVASVLVIPLCYYIMSRWLETFVFRTQPSWWIFVLVPVVVMLVTFAIIAVQVWNVARRNPVESLTSE